MRKTIAYFSLVIFLAGMVPFQSAFILPAPKASALVNTNDNVLAIKDKSGASSSNYPIQIARPFLQGAIANFPKAVLNGTPVTTQADVKLRYPDGSVKHAVLTFYIPTLPANGTVNVTFQNQTSNAAGALSTSQMLESRFNFDAITQISNGTQTLSASARNMLSAAKYEYWLSGSESTSVIIADHSLARAYDLGFDSHRSFRPIFHATFFPKINKVRVRYIGEISNTIALQDMTYNLSLKLGQNSENVYSKSNMLHTTGSRWTKEYWIGGKPGKIDIDHNLAYLAKTNFMPNYDTTKAVPESTIASQYSAWTSARKDLYDAGRWVKTMSLAGGRQDIGPYPTWTIQWLYTGDNRMAEQSFGQADLAAAWPVHLREGDPTKFIDREKTVSGVGRVLSISTRPSIVLWQGLRNTTDTKTIDKVVPVGTVTNAGWGFDGEHQPDPFSAQYALSGDYWYLEEMKFWASYSAARYNGAATTAGYGRGPTGAEGGVTGAAREDGWVFRNRIYTAFLSPDGTAEKKYFETLVDDALAIWEGKRNITNGIFYNNANWKWGNTIGVKQWGIYGQPPLRNWGAPSAASAQPPVDIAKASHATSQWMENYIIFALARAKELGYKSDKLLSWVAPHIINTIIDPGFDPHLVGAYRFPLVQQGGTWFPTYAAVKNAYQSDWLANNSHVTGFTNGLNDVEHGYPNSAMAALSLLTQEPGGQNAWNWIAGKALGNPLLNGNPKWALVPRVAGVVMPPPTPVPVPPPPAVIPVNPPPVSPTPQPSPVPPPPASGGGGTTNPSPTAPRHPRGALVNHNGTIYFMGAELRYPFPSAEVFLSWGARFEDVVPANSGDLKVPIGPVVEYKTSTASRHPRTTLVNINGTIYFLGAELRYPFPSAEVFLSWGARFDQVVPGNSGDMAMPIGPIVQMKQ